MNRPMTRGTLILTVVAGLLVFLVVLAFYLPASWFAGALPPQVTCRQLGGSIWHGECLGLRVQGAELGNAAWNLAPLRALTGRLSGDMVVRGAALNARADLDTRFSGVGELRNVNLRMQLDPALLPQLPREQRGTITANVGRLELAAGPTPRALQGVIELRDFRQVGSVPMELGSYQVNFDGSAPQDGAIVGKLRDLGGPFIVDGTIRLTAPNGYFVQGYITGRTANAERVVREITLGARPDASGRSAFSFEGTY
ncbi:MAG TPA: type II secretion system protein N [Steroidobacteraceae bacterium]|nr:type II secretion system protein N [Steroidobacteraceae bacterium]